MLNALRHAALLSLWLPCMAAAQDQPPRLTPAVPGSAAPVWQRALRLSDGRLFVTDGALAIDAALARPATMPGYVLPKARGSLIGRQCRPATPAQSPACGFAARRPSPSPGET